MTRDCEDCGLSYEAKRSTSRFCSSTCRTRARRAARAAEAEVESAPDPDGPGEHGLVRAVRLELAQADAVDTVAGQLALQIARRIADPEGAGVSTLSKELRSLLAEAKGAGVPDPDPAPVETEDEVTKARRLRDEQRAAAGLG